MDEARKAAQFLVDAYASRRPTGDTEPYALIVARALLAITPEVTHETMPGAERAQRTSEHNTTPEGQGGGERKQGTIVLAACAHCEGEPEVTWDNGVVCEQCGVEAPTVASWNRRPLLSSPRVEETRLREALSEASEELIAASTRIAPHLYLLSLGLRAAGERAKAALSPQGE